MHRLSSLFLIVLLAMVIGHTNGDTQAQSATQPQPGDPPIAALISVSAPDESGFVTVTGAQGSIFPNAQVGVRNLFTGQTVYTSAGFTGSFSAELYGPGQTPFLISPAASIPTVLRDLPGALPGGPATIIYGTNPEPRTDTSRLTRLIVDGDLSDWDSYTQASLGAGAFGLLNDDSFYFGFADDVPDNALFIIVFSLDTITYELTIDPIVPQASLLRELEPTAREPIAVAVAVATTQTDESTQLEMRLPRSGLPNNSFETARLEQTFIRVRNEAQGTRTFGRAINRIDEADGIVYPGGRMDGDFTRFYIAGDLAAGASYWSANGRVRNTTLTDGAQLEIDMDIILRVPGLSDAQTGLSIIGEIGLQPVTIGVNGDRNIPALHTNNGWSNWLTPSGLAIDNITGDMTLGTVRVPSQQVIRQGDVLLAGLRFVVDVPPSLPNGIYVPTFTGYGQIADGEVFTWGSANAFGDGGINLRQPITRLPFALNIGGLERAQLTWTLFYDMPSDGARGILADVDEAHVALSNRVRYNSTSYVLPPGNYPLEPYLLNLMPNASDLTLAPLLPLLFPGGRVKATITAPDGSINDLPDVSVIQSRLSSTTLSERDLFGAQPPIDAYRLMTGSPTYQGYPFTEYGDYEVQLTGNVDDVSGNRYQGGGTYRLTIAELLDLTPGVLPGTPFNVGDALYTGGRIEPGFPADVSVRVRVYALDGERIDITLQTTADRFGNFAPEQDTAFIFEKPGEYLIDYTVRYMGTDGRLWAASLRSAGIIATPDGELVARGQRGVNGLVNDYRPAWFDTSQYPPLEALADVAPRPNYPYFSGDVAFLPDTTASGLNPVLNVQDTRTAYRDWLLQAIPGYVSPFGVDIHRLADSDELPLMPVLGGVLEDFGAALLPDFLVNRAYAYISAVRPDVSIRQYVLGQSGDGLLLHWDNNDPLNQQIGAGLAGNRPGDFVFLFGGAVVKNAEANIRETASYAALAIITDAENARVTSALQGIENRIVQPLVSIAGRDYHAFFHPTGVRPGQVITQGGRIAIAGQAAPTLPTTVDITLIAPDGTSTSYTGRTNSIGYYYNPSQDVIAEQSGRWQVRITTTPDNAASVGRTTLLPTGSVLGAVTNTFNFYVMPDDAPVLAWSLNGDTDTTYAPGSRLNINVSVPEGWTQTTARYETTTASYLMESDTIQIFAASAAYQFDPSVLANNFPVEVSGGGAGARGGDVVTVTFIIAGVDAEGNDAIGVRRLYIFHDRLVSVDEQAANGGLSLQNTQDEG